MIDHVITLRGVKHQRKRLLRMRRDRKYLERKEELMMMMMIN
jgi:hypothetical protein